MNGLIKITIGDLLDQVAGKYPDHDAVTYTDRSFRKTYSELRDQCNIVARGLMAMGIKKGDHVAIWANNCPEWILIMLATAKIGAVMVTVNINYKVHELEYLLKQSDSTTLVMMEGFKDCNYVNAINQLCPEIKDSEPGELSSSLLPFLKNIIHIGSKQYTGMFQWYDLYNLAEKVSEKELDKSQASLDINDVINIQYTSGTTGFPKGVMLTHYNIVNNAKSMGEAMNFTHQDKLCIPVPLFHCFGCTAGIMTCVAHGATMVPIDKFQVVKVMEAIQNEACTAVHGVPTMFIAMLQHADFKKYKFPKLRTGIMAGAPCPITLMHQVIDQMGVKDIIISYGLTEASPACTYTNIHDSLELRVSTVGKTLPFIECKVVSAETNEEVSYGKLGELVVRGYNIMRGYYKMADATIQAIDSDRWLHTGDLATMDENGYIKITGRIKDMIIRGGENIYPKEMEDFLYTHPLIKSIQVIGVPSKVYGEEVMACIILKERARITDEEIKNYVKGYMARHKIPKYVKFMNSFPMTASGKVQKCKLREMMVKEFDL